jgi:hypothetical protein
MQEKTKRTTETKQEICGFLVPFFQVGTDRILWSISNLANSSSQEIHCLQDNDYLTVYETTGEVRWQGRIHFEYKRNDSPRREFWTRQVVLGHIVHGFQSNCEPKRWAEMFFEKLPATLKKK